MVKFSRIIGTSRIGEYLVYLHIKPQADPPRRIDEDKARKAREEMIRKKVIYGHSVPYRNMCRFNSGVSVAP